MRNTWIIIGIVVLLVLILGLGGGGMMMGFGMGPGMMLGYGFGFPFIGALFIGCIWLLLIAGVIGLIAWLLRGGGGAPVLTTTLAPPGETSLDILKMRYAKGEITKDQYDQMRRDLGT